MKKEWPAEVPKNIIIRMPNWLGDLVMATPLLADLRNHYPEARLTAMCQSNVAPLLEKDPHIDELLSFKRTSGWIHGSGRNVVAPLRCGDYDLGILTTNSFSSAWWFWRGAVANRVGFKTNGRSWLLDQALPFRKEREQEHLVRTYKELLLPLGIAPSATPLNLTVTEGELTAVRAMLKNHGVDTEAHTIIGINPGAAYGSAKCWLPNRFQAVARRLIEDPQVRVLFFGDAKGASLVQAICNDLPASVVNLAAKTSIRELMALVALCDGMLSNDSGPMHIAAAFRTPLVALFGSTNAVKTGPYEHGKVIHKHVSCSPCYQRSCPVDFRCMTSIEVDEVCRSLSAVMQTEGKTLC